MKVKDKAKLIELLFQLKKLPNAEKCADCTPKRRGRNCKGCELCQLERAADYLIENGVRLQSED